MPKIADSWGIEIIWVWWQPRMHGDCLAHLDAPTSYWGLHGTWTWTHWLKFTFLTWIWIHLSESLISITCGSFKLGGINRAPAMTSARVAGTTAGGFDSYMQKRRVSMWRAWHQHLIWGGGAVEENIFQGSFFFLFFFMCEWRKTD